MVFVFRVVPVLVAFNTTIMLSTNISVGLETLIPIYLRYYQSIPYSSTALFITVNSASNVEVFTEV